MAQFQIHALAAQPFDELFALDDSTLAARHMARVVASEEGGYPCRVSLVDATVGEELLLLPYAHHLVDSPYRASGPIFVRRHAVQAQPAEGEVPAQLRQRLISARVYDARHQMRRAEVLPGSDLAIWLAQTMDDPGADTVHLHNARYGCYLARATRSGQA